MTPRFSLRQKLGAVLFDGPRYAAGLRGRSNWPRIRNRRERLVATPEGPGFLCDWRWTSDLHSANVFPRLGRRLFRKAFGEWPIRFRESPPSLTEKPAVSFVIGHRGLDRLPLLLRSIHSLFAQENARCEFIVVEQDSEPRIRESLPEGVRYLFNRLPAAAVPYSRSGAFNAGAKIAAGELLVFHDNDTCVPAAYAQELLRWRSRGFEAMRLQRFVFYLSEAATASMLDSGEAPKQPSFDAISQNNEGVTIAVARDAFFAIGGFDEAFVGWGGEDNEFFERVRTLHHYPFGYLPFLHLHHPPQAGKSANHPGAAYLDERSAIPPEERIRELSERP